MKLFQQSLQKFASALPLARKEQLLGIAQQYAGEVAYFRLAKQGFQPKGIIDIGAYEGGWTRQVRNIFPSVPIFMVEAQYEKQPILESVKAEVADVDYAICLLGKDEGTEVIFNVMETGSSIYGERSNAARIQRTIKTTTLDQLIDTNPKIMAPFFLKLDVQGAELDVLAGGQAVLNSSEVVQLEVALLQYNEGAPLAHEVIDYMRNRGFLLFDISGFVKPKPLSLVQLDLLFVKENSKLRNSYFDFK